MTKSGVDKVNTANTMDQTDSSIINWQKVRSQFRAIYLTFQTVIRKIELLQSIQVPELAGNGAWPYKLGERDEGDSSEVLYKKVPLPI